MPAPLRIAALTCLALLAFAANSILCRKALGHQSIDAASFSTVRVVSGAVTLALLYGLRARGTPMGGSWSSAGWLFVYAVPFSFAYNSLATGTGALILFGAVQATMLLAAVMSGERPAALQWLGFATAVAGLVYLVLPGVSAPEPVGSVLMVAAGIGWGTYSLRGRAATDALGENAGNFLRAVPMVLIVSAASFGELHLSGPGLLLAATAGALASGAGYAIWYAALPDLTATLAATVQLSVPVIAAAGGVVFMAEPITARLAIASVLILGGVALAVLNRRPA